MNRGAFIGTILTVCLVFSAVMLLGMFYEDKARLYKDQLADCRRYARPKHHEYGKVTTQNGCFIPAKQMCIKTRTGYTEYEAFVILPREQAYFPYHEIDTVSNDTIYLRKVMK